MTTASIHPVYETEESVLDTALAELAVGALRWAETLLADRADLLLRTHASAGQEAATWAAAAVAAKRTPLGPLEGEEWISGPSAFLQTVEATARSLQALADRRSPLDGARFGSALGRRTTVQVLPSDRKDWVLLNGFHAEVWLRPGISASEAKERAGLGARERGVNGGVGLVLGAGNISSIGPLDVLYELVAHNRATVLKLNPTFAALQPVLERALAPLVEADLLRIVNGGASTGGYLARHPGVGHVHITGSAQTHDAIVWGTGDQAAARRGSHEPLLDKAITSELGGVSPTIVVPGRWSKQDLRYQAEHVVTMRLHNGGHNCIAGQVLILSSAWEQREEFLAEIRNVLDELAPRQWWYPGSEAKLAAARRTYPAAEQHGDCLVVDVDAAESEELFSTEYFAGVLGITSLPGTGGAFLDRAVAFANEKLTGTLGAAILVHPRDREALGREFDEAVAALRYGTVGINAWSAVGFLLAGAAWGAYPGHTLADVGSGIGVVHNAFLIADTEKTVVTGPFRPFPRSVLHGELTLAPRPPWFVTAKTARATGRALTEFSARRTWPRVLKVVPSAMRG